MRTRSDRLRTTAVIVTLSVVVGLGLLLVGYAYSEDLFRNAALAATVVGSLVFAPLYYLYASWYDEVEALEGDARDRRRKFR